MQNAVPNAPVIGNQGMKLRAAAAYLGLSEVTVRRLVARGELKPVRAVRHLLFSRASLDLFLAPK